MPVIHLLREDPDLAGGLSRDEREAAERVAVARSLSLDPGPWDAEALGTPAPGSLGLLLLEGVIARDTVVAGRAWTEVMEGGELVRPWDTADGGQSTVPAASQWTVLLPTRAAILDRRFTVAASRWPALIEAVVSRMLRRVRWMSVSLAINSRPRIDERLIALLWVLADRWGRVGPDGVHVPLPLTHELLARMVGAQRPSVTTALSALAEAGLVHRAGPRDWLLTGDPDEMLDLELRPAEA